jgi:hypothetical protein
MANAPQIALDFANLQKIGEDFARRIGAGDRPDDPAVLGQQKLAEARSRLDALQLQRKRLDDDIALAQRNLQEATRLAQAVVAPAPPKPAPAQAAATSPSESGPSEGRK